MDLVSFIWLLCLIITHICAYFLGRGDGRQHDGHSDDAWVEVKKYEIDKKIEYMQRMAERNEHHEA